eukprot:m51a1_g9288 putative swarming motility protein ybia (261) ;mRNA; r:19390-20354
MERAVLRAGEAVLFYDPPDPYFELSNFWPCRSLVVDGVAWPTTEHLYQASKFADEALRTRVRLLPTPRAAFDFTRDPANAKLVRGDWDDAKVDVMRGALRHKFTQDEALRDLLLATGEAPLVEHSAVDPFWGDGGDGSGRNVLGRLLMDLRQELAREGGAGRRVVTWSCVCSTRPGDCLRVAGDHCLLGQWDPLRAPAMSWVVAAGGAGQKWSLSLRVPEGFSAEYKYVLVDGAGNVVWEQGNNRSALSVSAYITESTRF